MGRVYTFDTGETGKFWFGSQPTSDLLEFGNDESESRVRVCVYFEELKEHKKKVENLKKKFQERFNISYKVFMKVMNKKGYMSSSSDKQTQTKKWSKMCREASLIELGDKIVKALKNKQDDLYIEGEI